MFVALFGRLRLWLAVIAFAACAAPQTAAAADFTFATAAGNFIEHPFGCGNCNNEVLTWTTNVPLPAGVYLQSFPGDGPSFVRIRGNPTEVVTKNVILTGTRPNSGTVSLSIDFDITAPTIALVPAANAQLAIGRVNVPGYSQQFSASGGNTPYAYIVTGGSLPPGLSLDPDSGLVSGTPTGAGIFGFQITATDSTTGPGAPFSVSHSYSITIRDTVAITTASPPPIAQVGVAYNLQLAASGGDGVYTFTNGAGMPAGLTLSASGLISGTPTQGGGPLDVFITATDQGGYTGTKLFRFVILPPSITIQPSTLNAGRVGVAFNQTMAATGGTAPYTYSISSGALPAGVTLAPSTGALSGTPTAGGTFTFTIRATDSSTGTGSPYYGDQGYTWVINPPTLSLSPASGTLPGATQGTAYSQTFVASGGIASYTYTITAGALPTGLSLSANGALTGTPTASGTFNISVAATDSATGAGPYSIASAYSLTVQQAVPTVASISPTSGPTAGGTTVIITGANFQNASSVTFGSTAATNVTVDSPTQITATTPAHAAGAVSVAVTTPGGTGALASAYTYIAPGAVRFVVNSGDDDGSFAFTSATPGLSFTVTTSGGTGSSPTISLAPGSYSTAFSVPSGFGLDAASCSPSTSTVNTSARTASLVITSNVTTVCTIEALGSRRAAVETIGAALDASSRLILANAPDLSRRLDRLNGGGGSGGSASAFGKTFAANLPFSASLSDGTARFSMSLSGLRKQADTDHRFAPANDNGVPASLAATVTPASGLAATAAGDASASLASRKGPRFDIWVEGVIAQFNGAASSDGDFAIVHAGADYLISDNVLIGAGIQGDWLDMNTPSGSLDSSGWLAGPYLTARLSDGLYIDARAAWGGASFDVSPFGTYTDTVDSDRALYSFALIGAFKSGNLTIRPEGRVTWYRETTDAYVDSLSVAIPEVEIKTGEATFGPTFEWTIERAGGAVLTPSLGFDLVWTFEQENTATAFTGAPGLDDTGIRGRLEAGLGYVSANGVSVGGSLFYDGIGGGDFEAWGGKANLRFGF